MDDKQKNLILAVAKAMNLSRDDVQSLRQFRKDWPTMRSIITHLDSKLEEAKVLEILGDAASTYRMLKNTHDSQCPRELHDLWNTGVAKAVFSGGNKGASALPPPKEEKPMTTKELLKKLNALRHKDRQLKAWKGSRADLLAAIKHLENKRPPAKVLPTGVAKGAYKTVRSASVKVSQTPAKKPVENLLTLSEIAAKIGLAPKVARAIARKNKSKLAALETRKYRFDPKHEKAVAKILGATS